MHTPDVGLPCDLHACAAEAQCNSSGVCAQTVATNCSAALSPQCRLYTGVCDNSLGCLFNAVSGSCTDGNTCTSDDQCDANGLCLPRRQLS